MSEREARVTQPTTDLTATLAEVLPPIVVGGQEGGWRFDEDETARRIVAALAERGIALRADRPPEPHVHEWRDFGSRGEGGKPDIRCEAPGHEAADRPPEPPTLDAAWKEALAAFPQGWGSVNIWPPFPGDPWMVQVTKQVRFGRGGASRYNRFRGEGDDLAAALRSLADALREAPR